MLWPHKGRKSSFVHFGVCVLNAFEVSICSELNLWIQDQQMLRLHLYTQKPYMLFVHRFQPFFPYLSAENLSQSQPFYQFLQPKPMKSSFHDSRLKSCTTSITGTCYCCCTGLQPWVVKTWLHRLGRQISAYDWKSKIKATQQSVKSCWML